VRAKEQEVNMTTLAPDTPEPNFSSRTSWGTQVVVAACVTFILSDRVIDHWHSYRLWEKGYSVLFLLIVLTLPWEGIRMKKRQNVGVLYVYILLMMVAFLFR